VLFAFPRKDKEGHVYAYKLVEHASKVPRFQAFRLKKYEMAIMDYDIRHFKSKWLPLVCSTVLHNGKTLFTGARTILELMDVPPEVAKKYALGMLAEGISMGIIAKITGLSEAEIRMIKSSSEQSN